jgi:hypothetical protein
LKIFENLASFNDSSWRATINPYLVIRLVKVFYEQTSNLLNSHLLATLLEQAQVAGWQRAL